MLNSTQDAELIQAVAGLNGRHEFQTFTKYLENSLEYTKQLLIGADSLDELRRLQGAAKDLEDLLTLIDKAPGIVAKGRKG